MRQAGVKSRKQNIGFQVERADEEVQHDVRDDHIVRAEVDDCRVEVAAVGLVEVPALRAVRRLDLRARKPRHCTFTCTVHVPVYMSSLHCRGSTNLSVWASVLFAVVNKYRMRRSEQ